MLLLNYHKKQIRKLQNIKINKNNNFCQMKKNKIIACKFSNNNKKYKSKKETV